MDNEMHGNSYPVFTVPKAKHLFNKVHLQACLRQAILSFLFLFIPVANKHIGKLIE